MEGLKECCRCKEVKNIEEFSKCKNHPDGLKYHCKKCASIESKTKYRELKKVIFNTYGNQCSTCGETTSEYLCLNHCDFSEFESGNKHREHVGGSSERMYRWIIKNNFPPMFNILCHNCNMSHEFYGYYRHDFKVRKGQWKHITGGISAGVHTLLGGELK